MLAPVDIRSTQHFVLLTPQHLTWILCIICIISVKEIKENIPQKTGFCKNNIFIFMYVNFNGIEYGSGIFFLFYLWNRLIYFFSPTQNQNTYFCKAYEIPLFHIAVWVTSVPLEQVAQVLLHMIKHCKYDIFLWITLL